LCNSNIVKISELKKGDVLLFSHTDEWHSKLISLLTNSPISHASMSYYNCTEIVEEVPPCASVNSLIESAKGRQVTVMRFDRNDLDMVPVLKIAEKYYNNKEPYVPKDSLYMMIVYILITKIPLPVILQKLLIPIIRCVVASIIKYIDEKNFEGKHPMICSQFVYRCYEEAGDEYKLIIDGFGKEETILSQVQEYINKNTSSLENKLATNINAIDVKEEDLLIEEEVILKKIYEALEKQVDSNSIGLTQELDEEFVVAIHEFCAVMLHLHNPKSNEILLNKTEKALNSVAIDSIMDVEEYFVFPCDFLNKCTNLINIGILENQ